MYHDFLFVLTGLVVFIIFQLWKIKRGLRKLDRLEELLVSLKREGLHPPTPQDKPVPVPEKVPPLLLPPTLIPQAVSSLSTTPTVNPPVPATKVS